MNMNNKRKIPVSGWVMTTLFIMMMIVALALLSSCTTTKYVPVIEHRTDTLIKTQTQRDSIWLHDSIRISENGDTIRIEKWHTKYVEKEVHDTTYIAKTDSIPQPYPVTEYVEKPLSTWQRLLIWVGILSIMGLILFIAYKLKKFLP